MRLPDTVNDDTADTVPGTVRLSSGCAVDCVGFGAADVLAEDDPAGAAADTLEDADALDDADAPVDAVTLGEGVPVGATEVAAGVFDGVADEASDGVADGSAHAMVGVKTIVTTAAAVRVLRTRTAHCRQPRPPQSIIC